MHPPLSLPYLILDDRTFVVPFHRGELVFAEHVREAVHLLHPTCLAVELPRLLGPMLRGLVDDDPQVNLAAWRTAEGRALYVASDPCDATIRAVRVGLRLGIDIEAVDVGEGATGDPPARAYPDPFAAERLGGRDYGLLNLAAQAAPATPRAELVAARLRLLRERHERVLAVLSFPLLAAVRGLLEGPASASRMAEEPAPAAAPRLLPVKPSALGIVLREIPSVAHHFDAHDQAKTLDVRFSMVRAYGSLLRRAATAYRKEYDERINLTRWHGLFQYARNLALVRGRLRPGLVELITAAKGCVDDDFAAILYDIATRYPQPAEPEDAEVSYDPVWPDEEGEVPPEDQKARRGAQHQSLNLYADFSGDTLRLEPAYPTPGKLQEIEFVFRRRKPSQREQELWGMSWQLSAFFGSGICSWPPEDERIEDFLRHTRNRLLQEVGERHTSVEEFSTSLLDGLDARETVRRWHEKKVYVRRERRPPGQVGPVVVIWRDAPVDDAGLWRSTLYAENQNESDISIYCAPLGEHMVGPGITRTEYHGVLSVYPARGIPDVWTDLRFLERWGTCARVLIAAGIRLSEERYVGVISMHRPDAELRQYARENGVALLHMPLGRFSSELLKRVRRLHILSGRNTRDWAGDYIEDR